MKVLTVLRKAKALIDAGRWLKGEFREKDRRINVKTGWRLTKGPQVTCYCAGGAIRAAAKQNRNDFDAAERIFLRAIGKYYAASTGKSEEIWYWNDAKHRTVGQVRKAFDRAVRIAEKKAA